MIKVLVPVEADLASSIALRYVCQIANLIETEILTINVRASSSEEYPVGTGWVRHTWEKTMIREAEDDVRQLIRAERANCPTLGEPMVVLGDRDDEILKELQSGYSVFGMLNTIPRHAQIISKNISEIFIILYEQDVCFGFFLLWYSHGKHLFFCNLQVF